MSSRGSDSHGYAKVVFIGDSGVGKTCLMNALLGQKLSKIHVLTTGPEFRTTVIKHRGTAVHLQMWDTAGQEIYRSITRMYFRNSHVVLVCFDLTSRDSFVNVDDWLELVAEEVGAVSVILVATKKDLTEGSEPHPVAVTLDELEAKAAGGNHAFIQTSAVKRDGIESLLELIGEAALNAIQPSPSALPVSNLADREQNRNCC
jgi:small GTP-binding protein